MTIMESVRLQEQIETGVDRNRNLGSVPENPFAHVTAQSIIQQHRFLPDHTAILGLCEDGLPVMVDWLDPRPGSFLIGGTNLDGITQLLQLATITTMARTMKSEMAILILSSRPENWSSFQKFPGSPEITIQPIYERKAGDAILRCSRQLDQRMNGRTRSILQLVIVDNLAYLNHVDFDVQVNFRWFARQGPDFKMWTIAGIDSSQTQDCDSFLPSFQTRILGQTNDPFQADWLANGPAPDTTWFHPRQQFAVRIRHNWMNFWLPGQV